MTDTVAEDVAPEVSRADDVGEERTSRRNRLLLVLSAVAGTVPFFWAAVRDGRNGFYPTMDVAATIIRARATFSAHPPLYGMWSSGSSWAGHEIHFPGPILLYLLAVPVHVLGNTWGPLLGMAVINSAFVLMTGWLIHRRLGVGPALVSFALFNCFIWSIGSENLVDARPMEMVTIPFLCFLFLVWLVASGEIDVLPGLAVVANYLFLNHLVMSLQVPVIGLCAIVGVVWWIRRARTRPDPTADESGARPPRRYRHLRRRLLQTGAITFVMWLPSLVDQFFRSPGNLWLLIQAGGQDREPVGSYVFAYNATVRLIAEPTFWFRGRFADADFTYTLENLTAWDVIGGIVVVGLIGGLAFASWRRRDRFAVAALGVAAVAIAVSVETAYQAPGKLGFPMQYLRSLWCLAAFVWFAVGFSVYRLLADRLRARVASVAGIAAVCFALAGLSYANYGAATDMDNSQFARQLVDEVVPQLTDRGLVSVDSALSFTSHRFTSTLLLGLDTAGVHFCVNSRHAQQYGHQHDCQRDADVRVWLQARTPHAGDPGKVIGRVRLLDDAQVAARDESKEVFAAWLSTHDLIEVTPEARRRLAASGVDWWSILEPLLAPSDGDVSGLIDSQEFRMIVGLEAAARERDAGAATVIADADAPVEEMRRYFDLTDPERYGDIWVYERSPD